MVGNLCCGFSRNLEQLIVFQVFSGLGAGGILCLVLIIVSDVSTLRTRGKVSPSTSLSDRQFQALVGIGVALGAGIGPFLGGVFTQKATVLSLNILY
jgi:MFS family permease